LAIIPCIWNTHDNFSKQKGSDLSYCINLVKTVGAADPLGVFVRIAPQKLFVQQIGKN
jgi:hypothetical protein